MLSVGCMEGGRELPLFPERSGTPADECVLWVMRERRSTAPQRWRVRAAPLGSNRRWESMEVVD